MKVKISETGEIKAVNHGQVLVHFSDGTTKAYKSISDLSDDLKDYEEPKDVWWLDNEGFVNHASSIDEDCFEKNKEIGNYFNTKEEAEKAVEKLKAWKRLKDKGVRPTFYTVHNCEREFVVHYAMSGEPLYKEELMLLFGGDE